MKIAFLELESEERDFFESEFAADEVLFPKTLDEVPEDTEILSIFIGSCIGEPFLASHPALRLVATRSTTCDHIDLMSCERHGVAVRAVESYGDYVVAEHTFALLLALTRRLREAMQVKAAHFSYASLRGTELYGKTLGLLGAGRIGLRMVPMGRAFGMNVIAHDIAPRPEEAARLGFAYVDFDELLERSDVLSLHVPLTAQTLHILNRSTLGRCRPGVIILNTARGRLIDTEALLEALLEGTAGGAGLDVVGAEAAMRRDASHIILDQILARLRGEIQESGPDRTRQIERLVLVKRLLAMPNVVFTPHIAFNCTESIARIQAATAENIRRFRAGIPAPALAV